MRSMSQQAALKFCILLRETLLTSISLTGINKYGKGAVVKL